MDVSAIAHRLTSKKVKDRTDALDDINATLSQRARLDAKSYRGLLAALARFVSLEANNYAKAQDNSAVETRLVKGITTVRELVAKTTRDGVNIKLKGYLLVVDMAIDAYECHHVLSPCFEDLLLIIDAVVSLAYVRDHMGAADWTRILRFLLSAADSSNTTSRVYQQQLTHSLAAVAHMVACPVSTAYLSVYNHYLELEPLIKVNASPRARVNQLRLINKLAPMMVGINTQFVARLVGYGINILTAPLSAMETMHTQVVAFLNSPTTVDYAPVSFSYDAMPQMARMITNLLRSVEVMPQLRWRPHHSPSSEPYRYIAGLSKLVTLYFTIKHQQQKLQRQDSDELGFGTGLLAASTTPTNPNNGGDDVAVKRIRREPLERQLAQASTAVGFCFSLVDFDSQVALQLLAFISIDDVVSGYLAEPELTYWALQVMAHQLQRQESGLASVALLRQILPYIKSPAPIGAMACRVFNLAVIKGLEPAPNAVEVTAVGHQFNGIINFADTSGPSTISSDGLEFWGFLSEAAASLSVKLSSQMPQRVSRWFAVKWSAYIASATAEDVAQLWGSLHGFIGSSIKLGEDWHRTPATDNDEYTEFWDIYRETEEIVAKHPRLSGLKWRSPVISCQIVAPEVMGMLHVVGGQPGVAFAAGLIELSLGKASALVIDDPKSVMVVFNRVSSLLSDSVRRDVGRQVSFDPLAISESSSYKTPENEELFDRYMDAVVETEEKSSVPTWIEAKLGSNNITVSAIEFIAHTRPSELVSALESTTTSLVLWALPSLLKVLNSDTLAPFIDYFGTNILASADYRCAEVVVTSAVKLVELTLGDDQLVSRGKDISRWLLDLINAGLVVTEPSLIAIITWLCAGASDDPEKVAALATLLSSAPISTKFVTANVTADLIRRLPPAAQKAIITAATIVVARDSDTEAITTLIYRGILASGSYVAMYSALFAIMEAAVSENPRMVEYAPLALEKIGNHYHYQSLAQLFHSVSYDLLAWKWTNHGDLKHFPFDIFGIDLGEAGYLALSREMTSVVLALPRKGFSDRSKLAPEAVEVLEDIATVKQTTVSAVVEATLPESIALAYTKQASGTIFQTLRSVLELDHETMLESSMVIMLAILRRLDVSQEDEVIDAFDLDSPLLHDSATIVDDPSMLRIVPAKATQLLQQVAQQWTPPHPEYGNQPGFVRHKWVYFWLRHLCADALAATMADQRILAWRRVKVALALCKKGISRHSATIVSEAASQMMKYPEVASDVYLVLEVVDLNQVSDLAVLLALVRSFLTAKPPDVTVSEVALMAERVPDHVAPLFTAACSWLRSKISTLTATQVDAYLSKTPSDDGVNIIATIWTPQHSESPQLEVVRNITAMATWPSQLEEWRNNYCARYYLEGHPPPPQLNTTNTDVVEYKSLNQVLNVLVSPPSRDFFTSQQWGYVEAALAVLMKEYAPHGYPGVLTNFATTSNCSFGRYVQEITMKAYDMVMPRVPAVVPIEDIDFESAWVGPWMSAILADLTSSTVVARVMLPLVASLPQLARQGLVATVCYYLWNRGRVAVDSVVSVLTTLTDDSTPLSLDDQQVVVEVALGVRASAKREGDGSAFAAVWSALDLTKIVDYAIAVGQPRTAMMIAEDASDTSPDWSVFNRIYPQIDDDLVEGLPQPPTLSAVLGSLVRDHNNPQRRGQWLQANTEALEFCGHRSLPQDSDDEYQCWRLNQWDLPPPANPKTENGVMYAVLKQVKDQSVFDVGNALKWASTVSPECMAAVEAVDSIVCGDEPQLPNVVGSELAIQARQVGYQLQQNLEGVILESVRLAQVAKSQKSRIMATFIIDEQCREVPGLDRVAQYHDAHIVWDQGMASAAISLLEGVGLGSINVGDHAQGLNVHGSLIAAHLVSWQAQSRQAHPRKLMEELVVPQVTELASVVDPGQWTADIARAYRMFGQFCESQSKSASLDEEIATAEKRLAHSTSELETWKRFSARFESSRKPDAKRYADARRQYDRVKYHVNQIQESLNQAVFAKRRFAATAVECYAAKVALDADDETTDRFFAGWLQSSDDHDLQRRMATKIGALPAHHLVSWTNQLVSRLDGADTPFQQVLASVLIQLVLRHPLHSVYQLISLLFGDPNEAKVKAAYELWQRILAQAKNNHQVLKQIYRFCKQVMVVAMKKSRRVMDLSNDGDVAGWVSGDLPPVPPPTMSLRVRPDENYRDVVTMASALPKAEIAPSGLSKPKIITFVLSDGTHHKLLAKHGNDDLRQDQIMEQVFEKVNQMLLRDSQTLKRRMRIRTYTVVPLGPQSGMIEFVPDAAGLIEIVRPYHRQMDSMTADEARSRMKEVQKGDRAQRIAEYRNICDHIHPVIRHWFRNQFVTPQAWYSGRVNWTRGVASSSMIGHILGLGDRHCNNVMIDTGNCEPIHIDLGVAFDQGKRLTIPETVPFRLTRDIVDGFGPTGVDGMFTKGCEYTLRVLRANRSHILAILDVLRWDPLYSWSVSAAKLARLQSEGERGGGKKASDIDVVEVTEPKALLEDDGSEAAKAIVTVSDKLRGIPGNLSVEANVRELIQEATSDENLALIYQGWSPFF